VEQFYSSVTGNEKMPRSPGVITKRLSTDTEKPVCIVHQLRRRPTERSEGAGHTHRAILYTSTFLPLLPLCSKQAGSEEREEEKFPLL